MRELPNYINFRFRDFFPSFNIEDWKGEDRYWTIWEWKSGIERNLKYPYRRIRAAYQRYRYGVSYEDTWNLDSHLARVIINGLEIFSAHGYPPCLDNVEDWRKIVKDMRKYFEDYVDADSYLSKNNYSEEAKKEYLRMNDDVKEGLELLAKWFQNLWD